MISKRLGAAVLLAASIGQAATIAPEFAGSYSLVDLGGPSGVPGPLGGLTVSNSNANTLLIGGSANGPAADIYSIGLTRNGSGNITGFSGTASFFADAFGPGNAGGIDGGLAYGPDGVLFYTAFSNNGIGQIKPGSTGPDKLTTAPIGGTVGTLAFVPTGFAGAGMLALASYSQSTFGLYSLTPDGSGTFNLTEAVAPITIGGGPEGILYVPLGSALFANPSVLISEYGAGTIAAYELGANGLPIPGTRRVFITGLSGAEGAALDPVTNDFLFSTFGSGNTVIRVSGFAEPPPAVPEPGTWLMLSGGLLALGFAKRKR